MKIKISRILHAGYVFECGSTQIAFDPIFENPFSRNCHAFPNVEFDAKKIQKLQWDAVFISHYHDDHCSLQSLNLLDRKTPIYIYCLFEELFDWIRKLGFVNVFPLTLNSSVSVGDFEIVPRRALDADVDSIFQIKAAGMNILNVVDSWIDEETLQLLKQQGSWDLILWPFQTMREVEVLSPTRAQPSKGKLPEEWIEQLKILNPRFVVPSSCQFQMESWSWYNQAFFPVTYRRFQTEVESALPQAKVIRMNPSISFELDSHSIEESSPLPWMHPIGEQNVDYQYESNLKPPSTSEIAKHFAPLTESESKRVLDYCRFGLIEKYQSLLPPEDDYFSKKRIWRLSVYDHDGQATHFYYQIQGSQMEPTEMIEPLSWTTEVPMTKLYAALEKGESLTSMYMRVNDNTFEPSIEREIQKVDVVEDPLMRCLFNGVFGAYQLAQLQQICPQDK